MKGILIFTLCLFYFSSFSQNKGDFYPLDANWQSTTLDASVYILWVHQKDNKNWQWDYYNLYGPLIKSESYLDKDGTLLNGFFCIYNKMGNLDSSGIFAHGKKNGSFYKLKSYSEDSINYIMQYDYSQDSLVKVTDLALENKRDQSENNNSNTKESEYPGGLKKWREYLTNSLSYPERALQKEIQGQVRINFLVDENGKVLFPFIEKSTEYSLDQEALRIIKDSGKWVPGIKDGVPVRSYKSQPINFRLR